MALYSKTVTGLINGVSRQPYALRLESQGYEQVNCLSSISKGVRRRPGMKLKVNALLPFTPYPVDAFHWIERDETHRYLVWIDSTGTNYADVRIIDLVNGTAITPTYTAGRKYLRREFGSGNSGDYLRMLTVGDRTYIVNTTQTPAMGTAKTANPAPWAFVWVKAAVSESKYTVNLKKIGGSAVKCEITSATKTTTETIASQLATNITAQVDFSAEAIGSLIVIKATAGSDFTISTSDGWGDQALVAVKNKSKVQSFAALPPTGVDGMIVEVEGDPETSVDSYYVKFVASGSGAAVTTNTYDSATRTVGTGVWEETVKWDTAYQINADTMPVTLTGNANHAFELNTVSWAERKVGDTESAPDPAFIGQPIQDIAFFKNRLAFITGESVAFSAVGEYESFFPSTVTTLADDDAFDVTANFPEVAKLRYGVPFSDTLVLFSDAGIFGTVGSPDGLTPKTVQFLRLANFTGRVSTRPVMAGDRIFFTEARDNETVLREFFQVDTDGTYVVEAVSEHVDDYIAPNARRIAADGVNGIAAVLSGAFDVPQVWVYQYFHSNREKVQSSWHRWTLSGYSDVGRLNWGELPAVVPLSIAFIDGKFYAAVFFVAGDQRYIKVLEMPLSPEYDPFLGEGAANTPLPTDTNHLVPYVDYWQLATDVTVLSGVTTMKVRGRLDTISASSTDNIICLPYEVASGWSNMGTPLTVTNVSGSGDETTITVNGELISTRVLVGVRMRSTYEFTVPMLKGQNTPVLGGRSTIKRARVHFESPVTVYGHLVMLPKNDSNLMATNRRQLYTQRREVEIPVHRVADPTLVVGVHSEMPLQGFDLYGVTWVFDFVPHHGARPV